MKFSLEVYADKPIWVREDSNISVSLRSHGFIIEESIGQDHYSNGFLLLSGKRLAGISRCSSYSFMDLFLCPETMQAHPGNSINLTEDQIDDLALIIQTDMILDVGILRQQLGIRLINKNDQSYEIPLARPDLEIYWDGRGRYVIPITNFVNDF